VAAIAAMTGHRRTVSSGPVAQAGSEAGTRVTRLPAGWQPAIQQTRLSALQIRTTAPGYLRSPCPIVFALVFRACRKAGRTLQEIVDLMAA